MRFSHIEHAQLLDHRATKVNARGMRREARLLLLALLRHHRDITTQTPPPPPGARIVTSSYTIQYGSLCARAGLPGGLVRVVGSFLGEIAVWSRENGFPPLNSLAVNGTSGIPGEGYDGAGGFHIVNWPEEVAQVIRFTGYPLTVP